MPVIDIELVRAAEEPAGAVSAGMLADAIGATLRSPPGRTWVRLRWLADAAYAENGGLPAGGDLPVFVTVLHARPPVGEALLAELQALTRVVADGTGRPPDRVHVQYAPPGAGRQGFGGRLVE